MMLNLIITAIFLISVAIAAGSIIITSQLRTQFKFDFLSTLLYMQVFCFMFGFYAIWGQVIVISYVTPLFNKIVVEKIKEITVLFGTPFIIFGWLMMLRLIAELTGKKTWQYFNAVFLLGNISFLVVVGVYTSKAAGVKVSDVLTYYYLISGLAYTLYGSISLWRGGNKQQVLKQPQRQNLARGIVLFVLAQNGILLFCYSNIWMALLFILLFFAGTAFIPIYLKYYQEFRLPPAQISTPLVLDDFCIKYEISPREKEIIIEICNGLSNQQIADKLFIGLQTVKDHTHRIYGKTLANSRMQLMKMVQEGVGK
jgi:DNA-binding CsgD family transcriptional regulator